MCLSFAGLVNLRKSQLDAILRNPVESLIELLHNLRAFTSPVDEVVAWGEDTWP